MSCCQRNWVSRVRNEKLPNAVVETESSLLLPAASVQLHCGVIVLRLSTCHASSVVTVRSS